MKEYQITDKNLSDWVRVATFATMDFKKHLAKILKVELSEVYTQIMLQVAIRDSMTYSDQGAVINLLSLYNEPLGAWMLEGREFENPDKLLHIRRMFPPWIYELQK